MIANQTARKRNNNENSKCPRLIPRGWRPATYYPDPAIHALDPRFEKYWLKLSAVERLTTGLRWAEGPVWFGDGRYLLCSDIPNQRILKWEEETGASASFANPRISPMATRATARGGWSPATWRPPRHPDRI